MNLNSFIKDLVTSVSNGLQYTITFFSFISLRHVTGTVAPFGTNEDRFPESYFATLFERPFVCYV
jgi:hypothetical protein